MDTSTSLAVSPGQPRTNPKQRIKRVPIADLKPNTFELRKCVQGTISLREPTNKARDGTTNREVWIRDIAVSSDEAIAAAGLDPKQSDQIRDEQVKRRREDKAAIQTIPVILFGKFAEINLELDDIVLIRGSGVHVMPNPERSPSDHEFRLGVSSSDCIFEVIHVAKGGLQSKRKLAYAKTTTVYSLDSRGDLISEVYDAKQHSLASIYTKLGDLKEGMENQNTYGIVSNLVFPSKTSYNTYRVAILLCDETPETLTYPIEACAFPENGAAALRFLPAMTCFGTIVRLHRVKIKAFNNRPSIQLINHVSTMSITSMNKNDRSVQHLPLNSTISKSDMDWDRVEQLREFAAKVIAESQQPSFLFNQYLRSITGALQGPTHETPIVDVLAQVITLPKPDEGEGSALEFRVTDGQTEATVCFPGGEADAEETQPFYWDLVQRFVGNTKGAWIKIRDCQVIRQSATLVAHSGVLKGSKPTTFLRVPSELCERALPLTPSLQAPKTVIAKIQGKAAQLKVLTIAQVLSKEFEPPFRVMVRVTGIFPEDPSQLCKPRAQGGFSWAVALQLQDMTGRLDAVLTGEDAVDFFRMQPMDLASNEEARQIVESYVKSLKQEGVWTECALLPLTPNGKVYAIVDTVLMM